MTGLGSCTAQQPGIPANTLLSVRVPLRPVVAVKISFSTVRARTAQYQRATAARWACTVSLPNFMAWSLLDPTVRSFCRPCPTNIIHLGCAANNIQWMNEMARTAHERKKLERSDAAA